MAAMIYTEQPKNAEERVLESHNVVITGKAGTGKTALMKQIHFDLTFIGMQCLFQCIFNLRVFHYLGHLV